MKIQELSISECIVLAEKLWDNITDEDTSIELPAKQKLDLDSRLQAFLDDQDVGSTWIEIKDQIIGKI